MTSPVELPTDPQALLAAVRRGDRRALARAISIVEDRRAGAAELVAASYRDGSRHLVVGVTGAPGAGKSTLVDGLVGVMRGRGSTVGVVAVDPSSPFTGGAVLGDRVRMQRHVDDPGVYVRSMASRGRLGGLAWATAPVLALVAVAGFDELIVETVGVGQAEVEVAHEADTRLVVLNPGWGDAIQAAKAGLLEIADVFVLNKADVAGVDQAEADIRAMLDLVPAGGWRPPIVRTVAVEGIGVEQVVDAVADHRAHLEESGMLEVRRLERARRDVAAAVEERVRATLMMEDGFPAGIVELVAAGELDPWTAAARILDRA